MNRETLIIIGLSIAFLCGWSAPRNRYQLIHFDLAPDKRQYDATRIDTWTGEIQVIMRLPDPTGGDYLCDYWATVPVKKDAQTAYSLYDFRKEYAAKNVKK
jgi:hypothetical protein